MHNHPDHDDKKPTSDIRKRLLVAAGIVALIVLFVVLHLSGAVPRH